MVVLRTLAAASLLFGALLVQTPGVSATGLMGRVATADVNIYESALQQFIERGFDLPPVRVRFHIDDEPCRGNRGQVESGLDGIPTVHVCATHVRATTQTLWRERTLLHELSHVWVNANTGRTARAEFMRLRGVEAWFDPQHPWAERGIEHSAEVFMWGLLGCAYDIDFRIDADERHLLFESFVALTGRVPQCR